MCQPSNLFPDFVQESRGSFPSVRRESRTGDAICEPASRPCNQCDCLGITTARANLSDETDETDVTESPVKFPTRRFSPLGFLIPRPSQLTDVEGGGFRRRQRRAERTGSRIIVRGSKLCKTQGSWGIRSGSGNFLSDKEFVPAGWSSIILEYDRTNRYLCRQDNDPAGDVIVSVLVLHGTNCCSPPPPPRDKVLKPLSIALPRTKEFKRDRSPFFLFSATYLFFQRTGRKHGGVLLSSADYLLTDFLPSGVTISDKAFLEDVPGT